MNKQIPSTLSLNLKSKHIFNEITLLFFVVVNLIRSRYVENKEVVGSPIVNEWELEMIESPCSYKNLLHLFRLLAIDVKHSNLCFSFD